MGRTGTKIELTANERSKLKKFATSGNHPARIVRRASIILALDASSGRKPALQKEIAANYGVSQMTVINIKQDFCKHRLKDFLSRKKRESPPVPAKADGDFEAHLIALCCAGPPEGYARWSLRLLADRTVELGYIDSVSHTTIDRVLKKTNLSLI